MWVVQLGPFPPPYGGVQANLVAIREHLRRNGIVSGVINLTRHRKEPGDEVYYPETALQTALLLVKLPARILHLHIGGTVSARAAMLGLFCSWLPGRKAVLTFHSGGYPSSAEGRAARAGSFRGFVFRQFDRIIVVNSQLRDVFQRYGVPESRIRLILPHAVDFQEMSPVLPEPLRRFYDTHKPILLTVGLLEPEYDLASQIDVLETVLQRYPDAGLAIIGSGALEQELRERIDSKPYREHILLTGDMPHSGTLRAIQEAGVLLRTTLYDGDAVSVRESLFLGTPVIATENGMRPDGVRLIPLSDMPALAQAIIEQLSGNSRPAARAGESGRENLEAVLELYRELDTNDQGLDAQRC